VHRLRARLLLGHAARVPPHRHPAHHKGVATGQPGLYFVGLPYQTTMASSLAGGVGADARYVTGHLAAHRPAVQRASTVYSP
jgi:putative flavoprotein involved in K+ transport